MWNVGTKGRYGIVAVCAAVLGLLAACGQPHVQLPPLPEQTAVVSEEYRIGPEDVVEVTVWKNPDLSRVVTVRPDGKISLPLIGDVAAAGKTAPQLAQEITELLKAYYKEPPQVSVVLQQVNSYAIYVIGEVRNPGKHVVKTGTTFLQAVALAGGFTEFASTNHIVLRRRIAKDQEAAMILRYRDVVAGVQDNIVLMPGDTLIVQ
ncbi:MAG: GumB protein [Candidatus Tectimicrobiota bacterium]|nr:MAG: GumB protein [Candidatus Tectomicrobia bacterium]